jgi:hypothetical protein
MMKRKVKIHFTIADQAEFTIPHLGEDAVDYARERVHEMLMKDGVNAFDFVCTTKEFYIGEEE